MPEEYLALAAAPALLPHIACLVVLAVFQSDMTLSLGIGRFPYSPQTRYMYCSLCMGSSLPLSTPAKTRKAEDIIPANHTPIHYLQPVA
jgi:hypothetical protein